MWCAEVESIVSSSEAFLNAFKISSANTEKLQAETRRQHIDGLGSSLRVQSFQLDK